MERRSYDPAVSSINERMAVIETCQRTCAANTERILKILEGNGGRGLVTQVALNQQSVKRLWGFVGGGGALTGIAIAIIEYFKKG